MVHPASGYMINRVFKYAPEVASAVAKTLKDTGSPQLATEAGWEAVWPKHRLIERDLYCFGMEVAQNPKPSNPKPSSPHPLPSNFQTLDPQPSTLNPQPSTLNPQPSTLNPR
jgi:hypothetical protein